MAQVHTPTQTNCIDNKTLQILCIVQALQQFCEDAELSALTAFATNDSHLIIACQTGDNRGGTKGRKWVRVRNATTWIFDYALRPEFRDSISWRAIFRVPYTVFSDIVTAIGPDITRSVTRFRPPLSPELKVAAFLMYTGGASCAAVGTRLGIGPSTVNNAVKPVSCPICSSLGNHVSFPTSEYELASIMSGIEDIRGLPYCIGAIDGTHVKWLVLNNSFTSTGVIRATLVL